MSRFMLLSLLVSALGFAACTPIGVASGAAASTGIAAAREGGISGALTDLQIKANVNDQWFRYDVDTFRKLNLTVDQGRVLVTGVVQKPQARVDAIRLVWQAKGVKQVINEIRVADGDGVEGYARDTWISTQLRTKMILDRDIQSINYSIDTVQGTVYLMGVSRYQEEMEHVIDVARSVPGVRNVVSYIKRAGEVIVPQQAQLLSVPNNIPRSGGSVPPQQLGIPTNDVGNGATVTTAPAPDKVEAVPLN